MVNVVSYVITFKEAEDDQGASLYYLCLTNTCTFAEVCTAKLHWASYGTSWPSYVRFKMLDWLNIAAVVQHGRE